TKAHILQAVREAKGEQSAQLIDHLKKPDMAREAARLLEGSGWLPEPLRLAVDEVPVEQGDVAQDGIAEDGAAEGADVDLPAFLTEGVEGATASGEDDGEEHRHLDAAE
ncbi:MAG TPA: DNA-binding protein, partial [Sphingomicrobium sp.]|nr:DNA-binding protein [Sphingomicrobium sp.]